MEVRKIIVAATPKMLREDIFDRVRYQGLDTVTFPDCCDGSDIRLKAQGLKSGRRLKPLTTKDHEGKTSE
jgi:hypothetical protein